MDLQASLLLPRHLPGDPIIESIRQNPPKIWKKSKTLNECRPGAARIFEDRGRSKCRETIIQKTVVLVFSQSNQPDHTELAELVRVMFRGIYFRRLFHLGAAVSWQRVPDSPRHALSPDSTFLLYSTYLQVFQTIFVRFGRLGFPMASCKGCCGTIPVCRWLFGISALGVPDTFLQNA